MAAQAPDRQEREIVSSHDIVNEETALLAGTSPLPEDDEEQECWNSPAINSYRFISVNLTLVILGLNDSCIGALIPYIEPYYDISYTKVSTLFVVPFAGYLVAALLNSWIHLTVGQRGIAFFGPFCRLIGYVPMALHPQSFWILPVCLTFTGFGNGISDSAWNAWVGNLQNTNELLGIIHGLYGAGGIIGPLIASAMVTKLGLQWYEYFYVMIGVSIFELIWATASFWKATAAAYRRKHKFGEGREPAKTSEVLQSPVPWLVAMVLFGYVGAEVCLGGWIPTFMINVRHADGFTAGLTVTLFWAGFTLGRVALGFITGRIGEKLAITIYLAISMTLQVLYWVIPSIKATIVIVVFLGFFLGPVFPAAIVVMTKLLPPDQHVISIGLTAALGGGGSAVFPFLVGAIAEHHGVKVLQPFVLAVLAVVGILWLSIPGGMKKGGLEKARREGFEVGGFVKGLFRQGAGAAK